MKEFIKTVKWSILWGIAIGICGSLFFWPIIASIQLASFSLFILIVRILEILRDESDK